MRTICLIDLIQHSILFEFVAELIKSLPNSQVHISSVNLLSSLSQMRSPSQNILLLNNPRTPQVWVFAKELLLSGSVNSGMIPL